MSYAILEEKTVPLSNFLETPGKYLNGVVRIIDDKAKSVGVFLNNHAIEDLLEDLETRSPKFTTKLEKSRKSGRVSATNIEKRLGL